jgi:hypothetical protein
MKLPVLRSGMRYTFRFRVPSFSGSAFRGWFRVKSLLIHSVMKKSLVSEHNVSSS